MCCKLTDAQRRSISNLCGQFCSKRPLRASAHVLQVEQWAALVDMRHAWTVLLYSFALRVNTRVPNGPTRIEGRFAISVSSNAAQLSYTGHLHCSKISGSQFEWPVYEMRARGARKEGLVAITIYL